jgi:hypothetical protein
VKTGVFANSQRTSSGSVSECASYRLLTEVRSYDHGGDDEHAAACTAWHYRIDPYREAAENRYPSASGSPDILAVLGEKVVPDSVLARHVVRTERPTLPRFAIRIEAVKILITDSRQASIHPVREA